MQTAFHRWRTGAEPRSDGKMVEAVSKHHVTARHEAVSIHLVTARHEAVSSFHKVKMQTAFHRWRTGAEPRSDGKRAEAFHKVNSYLSTAATVRHLISSFHSARLLN
jgi:hypothetical protein